MPNPQTNQLIAGAIVRGPLFPEPVEIITTLPMGKSVKLVGKGLRTGIVHDPVLNAEQHLDDLNRRLELRLEQLEMERHCTIGDIHHLGRAWVLPHPDRASPDVAPLVRDEEIERIAVQEAIRHEKARGWQVESVEAENRGFDLISRRPHPHDPAAFVEVRFIEVKGRAAVGEVALSANEYKTAQRLGADYWLYVVYDCATTPELHAIRDPARLGWKPVVRVAHYHLGAKGILKQTSGETP